jgi:hypothetical protein
MGRHVGKNVVAAQGAVEHRRDGAGDGHPERRVNPARDGRVVKRKKDPLLSALIARLPEQGSAWPADQQLAWLHLIAMAFGTVYGGDAAVTLGIKASAVKPQAPAAKPAIRHRFYIDEEGIARNAKGNQIKASDVGGDVLYDMRGPDGDLRSIVWADGSVGLNGQDLMISAG